MKFDNVYIYCPTVITVTGGTELLHQLSYKMKNFGYKNYMFYNQDYNNSPIQKAFSEYNVDVIEKIEDSSSNLLIVPETGIGLLRKFKHINKAIWWESVDNYSGSLKIKKGFVKDIYHFLINLYNKIKYRKIIHFVQSEYARMWLLNKWKVKMDNIFNLSDYLNSAFIKQTSENDIERENIVLFNPKKGIEFTKLIINELKKRNIKYIEIKNMTPKEVSESMKRSKVYIDFGNHPGKDRIPREAVISGCCIITGNKGSAANNIDIPISDKYKFDDKDQNIVSIVDLIEKIFISFDDYSSELNDYRKKIINEEKEFENQINSFFGERNE